MYNTKPDVEHIYEMHEKKAYILSISCDMATIVYLPVITLQEQGLRVELEISCIEYYDGNGRGFSLERCL